MNPLSLPSHGALVVYGAFLALSVVRIWVNRPGGRKWIADYVLGATTGYLVVFIASMGGVEMLAQIGGGRADGIFWIETAALLPACWLSWRLLRLAFRWPLPIESPTVG